MKHFPNKKKQRRLMGIMATHEIRTISGGVGDKDETD